MSLCRPSVYDSSLERSRRVKVCNAKELAKRWSGKEMAAQNVKHLEN
jgi:hypothetical protein